MSDYCLYDSELVPDAFGLNNTGAICWFNSLLQMMLSLSALNQTILECEHDLIDNIFAREYISILKLARDQPLNLSSLMTSSARLLNAMHARARQKNIKIQLGNGQECADEGYVTFIELLGHEKIERLFSNVYKLSITCDQCKKIVSSIRDRSFRIQMPTKFNIADQQKFRGYLMVHPSVLDYYVCDCGNKMVNCIREEKLTMLREIMVIVFDKFRIKTNQWFPEIITFNSTHNSVLTYRLVSKIEHSGNQNSGHYWAQSIRGGEWVKLNDTGVSPGNSNPTLETFMVAYHMIDPNDPVLEEIPKRT